MTQQSVSIPTHNLRSFCEDIQNALNSKSISLDEQAVVDLFREMGTPNHAIRGMDVQPEKINQSGIAYLANKMHDLDKKAAQDALMGVYGKWAN